MLRDKIQLIRPDHIQRSLCHLIHLHKPLGLDHGLHSGMAAVMGSDRMGDRDDLYQKPKLLQILHDLTAGLITVHAGIFPAALIHGRVIIEDIDLLQMMALPNLKIIGVMGRRDLDTSGSEILVHVLVNDHGNLTVCQRKLQHLPYQITVAFIIRRNSNRRISQHCLRAGGRNLHEPSFLPHNGIKDMPEGSVLVFMLHLSV